MAIPEKSIAFSDLSDLNTKAQVIGLKGTTAGESKPFKSVLFSRKCLEGILDDDSCTGIRFYLVADTIGATLRPTLMAVGENGSFKKSGKTAYVSLKVCPPYCPRTRKMEVKNSMNVTPA